MHLYIVPQRELKEGDFDDQYLASVDELLAQLYCYDQLSPQQKHRLLRGRDLGPFILDLIYRLHCLKKNSNS